MCGIIGYTGEKNVQSVLIEGLTKLEYRGYDSAGIATLEKKNNKSAIYTHLIRSAGKIINLKEKLKKNPCPGTIGVGHTRWATHGKPSQTNAHPHYVNGITIVHNGIIENHYELREQLVNEGSNFLSETDSEIFAHLICANKKITTSLIFAIKKTLKSIKGSYALVVLDEENPDIIICAKQMSSLVIGCAKNEYFIASDLHAILSYTNKFITLEDGDIAILTKNTIKIIDLNGEKKKRKIKQVKLSANIANKNGYKHFMHKEIHEQPNAINNTLIDRLNYKIGKPILENINLDKLKNINRIIIIACGTSYHAGLVAKYKIEETSKIPVEVELASEFLYRNSCLNEKSLAIGISQSGETADTIIAMKLAKQKKAKLLSICNVIDSSLTKLCYNDIGTLYTKAGIEISVASTKSFVTQIVVLELFALTIAEQQKTISKYDLLKKMKLLSKLPDLTKKTLLIENKIKKIAKTLIHSLNILCLGRGALFPIALEGALKIKELSYIHAEGYAAGEMKHGPIALIDKKIPVIILAIKGYGHDKIIANLNEMQARDAKIIVICEKGDVKISKTVKQFIEIPKCDSFLTPIITILTLQMLAYHIACLKGTDIDQPRNLAKSVTVE